MSESLRPGRWPAGLAALVLALAAADTARADLLFFKDGFVAQGRVRRESVQEFDPVGRDFLTIPKGFFLLDDGPRRIYFSPSQVRIVERTAPPVEERISAGTPRMILNPRNLPPLLEVLEAGEWDKKWERVFRFRSPKGDVGLMQHVSLVTPYFVQADAVTKFRWSCAYLTREVGPEAIQKLFASHKAFQETEKLKPEEVAARRLRKADFYVQAGWLGLAEQELDHLEVDQPSQKGRVRSARSALEKLEARDRWERIKRFHQAGQHRAARKAMAEFRLEKAPERVAADLRELQALYAHVGEQAKEASRLLGACARAAGARHKVLAEAAATIISELHFDNVGRLDSFLGQARQAERQRKAGTKVESSPEQLLALAVSGWLLGSPSAEAAPDMAQSLWRTRRMVLDYLKSDDPAGRQKLLDAYRREVSPRVEVDEVAQMIQHLPPVEPATKLSTEATEVTVRGGRSATTYQLQLPPEYSHNRACPVLIVLHNSGEKATRMLERWATAAAENGYLLAAPEWEKGLGNGYGFSEREHDTVLDTLRDLRRRFRVDSDRVFLFGLGDGGQMAFDVGLTHPSLFAGVIPMSAGPTRYPTRLWRNAQYLPFYVVNGNRAGEVHTQTRAQFDKWILRGYPALWVEYKGRGAEWLGGEVPNVFDWMRHKTRAFPLRQVGTDGVGTSFGNEFCAMRPGEHRFYWLSTSEVSPPHYVTPGRWSNFTEPAMLTGRIDSETNADGNDIYLKAQGLKQLSVWIGRNPRGQYMIDFDKPVTVRVGFRAVLVKRQLTPKLEILLDDLARRGDRQQLFVARIDVNLR